MLLTPNAMGRRMRGVPAAPLVMNRKSLPGEENKSNMP